MKIDVDTNEAKIRAAAAKLKEHPNILAGLSKDPHGILSHFGVRVDDDTAARIRQKAQHKAAVQSTKGRSSATHRDAPKDLKFSIDLDNTDIAAAAEKLKSDPELLGTLAKDARSVLSKLGVTVDDATAARIQEAAAARIGSGLAASSVVHIDI